MAKRRLTKKNLRNTSGGAGIPLGRRKGPDKPLTREEFARRRAIILRNRRRRQRS